MPPTPPTPYVAPTGSTLDAELTPGGQRYRATADWMVLRKDEKPIAEMFFVAYEMSPADRDRPVTFIFNGGPGASSVYLHFGAAGPKRIQFGSRGVVAAPPARVVDNLESWLSFSDLVFIDPIGTGFSRTIDEVPEKPAAPGEPEKKNTEFYQLNRDLESLGEFMTRFLSKAGRWTSPVFIAGESYGGFRVAKLARSLQEKHGIGLSGAILISPAMEFAPLIPTDYDVDGWIDVTPTMAAVAHQHGLCRNASTLDAALRGSEEFAQGGLLPLLIAGDRLSADQRAMACRALGDWIGLPPELCALHGGRVRIDVFARELLRAQRKVLGLYDGSLTVDDPFPDRPVFAGPDPTLSSGEAAFTAAANDHLRRTLGLTTDRAYRLLSLEVNEAWQVDTKQHALERNVGATDDLRFGMALNPHMRVFVCHGLYDLVTPYFASERLVARMRLTPEQRARVLLRHFEGGHMFYSWDASRIAFTGVLREFYANVQTR